VTQVAFHRPSNPRERAPGFALLHLPEYRLARRSLERTSAGIGFEDCKLPLGHRPDHVTTHCLARENRTLIAASKGVCELGSRESPARALLRAQTETVSA